MSLHDSIEDDQEHHSTLNSDAEPLITSSPPSSQTINPEENCQQPGQSKRAAETIQFYVQQLTLLFYPLIITFSLTCWLETTLAIDNTQITNPMVFYNEAPTDSVGTRLGGSMLNAVIMVVGITTMTFLFVLCFKYRLYAFLYFWLGLSVVSILGVTASTLWVEMLTVYNIPLDFITMAFCIWNFTVVGCVAIFWKSPLFVQQAYLVVVSAATSISMLRLPPWTTWTVLNAIAIYDLFAVLCPSGPLKMLINIAEERQEDIPALIYSAGMASFDGESTSAIGGYRTQESHKNTGSESWVPSFLKSNESRGYRQVDTTEEEAALMSGVENNRFSLNEMSDMSTPSNVDRSTRLPNNVVEVEDDDDEEEEFNAIKLGLGDFIFYSVLVGRASRTDPVTLCLCVIAILTGLSITIFILTLKRSALPALPISILFGSITYGIASCMTNQMITALSLKAILF